MDNSCYQEENYQPVASTYDKLQQILRKRIGKMFNNLKVKKKLLVGYGIVLIMTVLIAVFSMFQLKKANENLENFMVGSVKADDLIKDNRIATNIAARYLRDMVIEKMTVLMRIKLQSTGNIATIKNNFETLQSMDVLDQDALNEYQNAMEGWFDIGDKFFHY